MERWRFYPPILRGTSVSPDPLISIIEDDESLRLALVGLLRSMGYRAGCHGSAEEFLSSGEIDSASCIITDIQMRGLSGIGLKQLLDARACRTPVIMITARTEEALLAKALASGAFGLLKKPFEANALIECLGRALSM
jgi:FixJ family two-component response regulator